MPNSPAIAPQRVDLLLGDRIGDGQPAVGGGHVMIDGGHGPLGPPHLAAGQPQPLEGLRAGNLVDQLQVDVEDRLLALFGMDDVVVPDLLEHRPGVGLAGHNAISLVGGMVCGVRTAARGNSLAAKAILPL